MLDALPHHICASMLEHVGDTPLVELKHLDLKPGVRVFAKLEGQNPTGSVKDRIVYRMLCVARERGQIRPGATIVEATTGNTGIALAMLGRQLGYKVKVVVPENVFPEIGNLLRVYGAEIIWVPTEQGIKRAMELARELARDRGWFILDQFANEENSRAHYEGTGPEILADLPRVDIFVAGLGTGGTIMGTGRRLKEANPHTKLVAVEPHPGNQVQGLRSLDDGYIPPIVDLHMLDGRVLVRSRHAFQHAYELIHREGIFSGVSSGAVFHAAMKFARRIERGNIVCLFADAGWKYLGTSIWNAPPVELHEDDDMDDVIWW
ncbi:MAG: PLP-dependent cysteine synthase family protein [Dehalococcoidia bacterium]